MTEFLPIYVFTAISILCLALLVIFKIRDKRSVLAVEDKDFIETFIEKKKRMLNSNLGTISFRTYTILLIALPIIIGVLGWIFVKDKAIVVLMALLSVLTPDVIIKAAEKKQEKLFEERYARGLKALSAGLRSNLSIQQAVNDVSDNIFVHESIRDGFKQIKADLQVGMTVHQAFQRFADDTKSADAQDVASAIAMQSDVGGSEARVIENISNNIQNRILMRREIKSLFAETNIMITFMDFAPFLVFLILYFGAPQLVAPYFESSVMTMVLVGILLFTLLGTYIIRKQLGDAKQGGGRK